ncbi:probable cytochrome P450 4d14 [Culex pipiens pallens]|uniref:probable cytochrome P450 4d14 n=1 Tax=Culex pipiens pallens TaxID=42434 RepID=UPI001952ADF6|nr:probable cytochrome P450 4d14 [Culex pipiens pallens]
MLALILFTALIIAVAYIWQQRSRLQKPFESVRGPPALPLLGNVHQLVTKSSTEIFQYMQDLERAYGRVFKMDVMSQFWLFFTDANHIEQIMTGAEFNCKSDDYDMLVEWLGTGLLISCGNKWFTHRKALTSAFHFKILENFAQVFDAKSTILARKFLSAEGKSVKIFPLVKLCTLDVIVETAMGIKSEAQTKQSCYTVAVEDIAAIVFRRMFDILYNTKWIFKLTSSFEPYQKHLKTIHEFTLGIIEKKRQALQEAGSTKVVNTKEDSDVGLKSKQALLDILLQANIDGKPLTNEEVREEVDTFMFAGHDTTASAITFILFSLAKHPDIQQKVYEEVRSVFGDSKDTPTTLTNLNDLKYLELVIKESLRMFPPVPFISRNTSKQVSLAGLTIPPNTNISIGIYNMHHNPNYFPDPERFVPERFEAERGAEKLNPYAYVPFSAGGRNCIGQKFAMYELKATISKVVRWCRVELDRPDYRVQLKAEMILKPMDEMPLRFYARGE